METQQIKTASDRLIIFRLGIHQWYPRKKDARALRDLAQMHNINEERLGTVQKNLVNMETIKPLQQRCRQLRNDCHSMTAPWEDGGLRALPAELYLDFVVVLREGIAEIAALADDYRGEYQTEIGKAEKDLNGLFNADDYPRPEQMRARFSVDYSFKPVPNAEDCRVWGIGDDAAAEIADTVRADITAQIEQAQWHVVSQVMERAAEFVEKIRKFTADVQGSENGARMYDSAHENLREVLELVLNGLNFTADPAIEKLCKDLRGALKGANASTLRNSESTRENSTAKVEKLLAEYSEKFAGVL